MCAHPFNIKIFQIPRGYAMTKVDLVSHIAKEADITKKAATSALNAIVGAVHDSLKKKTGSIRISDLGTFRVVHKKARAGVNPQTGQKIKIPATKVPRFSASKALKDAAKKSK
jgi:DNA-binding protein HU-beta